MKHSTLLIISVFILQFNSSAVARDDLIVNKEEAILKSFSEKYGQGQCTRAVDNMNSLPSNVKNSCNSFMTKVGKARRHCSSASDIKGCNESVLDMELDEVIDLVKCCIHAEKKGKR